MITIEIEFGTDDERLRELCRQYWQAGEDGVFVHPVSRLAELFDVHRSRVAATVASACHAFCRDECCTRCGTPRPYTSRAEYSERRRRVGWTSWVCQGCQDAQRVETQREAQRKAEARAALIRAELQQKREPGLTIESLSFNDAVFLLGLVRVGASEDLAYVAPPELFTTMLSPTIEFDREILDTLYRHNVICIHPGSRPESVVIENERFTRFFPFKVHWILPLPEDGPSPSKFVENLEALLRSGDWPEEWMAEATALHRTVALQECLQYLRLVLEEHGFEPRFGDKTSLVLNAVLRDFSVGQAYNFIWRAARDAAAFFVRDGTSRTHAANIVPGAIQRMAERAQAEGWDVKAYRRDFRAPQSQLSQVLFTLALKLPEGGFLTIPPRASEDDAG